MRNPRAVLPGTLLVALAGSADTMAAMTEFTADHQAWFRLWLPLGATVPTDNTCRRHAVPAPGRAVPGG